MKNLIYRPCSSQCIQGVTLWYLLVLSGNQTNIYRHFNLLANWNQAMGYCTMFKLILGPFVMNDYSQINDAMTDFSLGENGFERAPGWKSEIGRSRH